MKNGDEKYADCGGSCRQCSLFERIENNMQLFIKWGIILVAALALFLTIILTVKNYFLDVKTHKKMAPLLFGYSLIRYSVKKVKWSNREIVEEALEKLAEIEHHPGTTEEFVRKALDVVTETYSSLFALQSEFKAERLYFEIKSAAVLPRIVRSMLLSLYSRIEELMNQDYIYAVQVERLIKDAKAVLKALDNTLQA